MSRRTIASLVMIAALGLASPAFPLAGGGLAELLRSLETGVQPGDRFVVTEGELNTFISTEVEANRVTAVRSVAVRVLEGRFQADIDVDLDQVNLGDSAGAALFRSLLSGRQRLALEGLVEGTGGVARYRTQSASVNGVPLPPSLVDLLLKQLGEKQDPPFDPTGPIPLPRGLKTIRLLPGTIELGG
jgi:hypothetical protein